MSHVSRAAQDALRKVRQLEPSCQCFVQGGVFEEVLLGPVSRPVLLSMIEETIDALEEWSQAIQREPMQAIPQFTEDRDPCQRLE